MFNYKILIFITDDSSRNCYFICYCSNIYFMFLCFAGAAGMKAAITYPLPITNMYKNLFQHTVEDLLKCPNLANGLANTFITKIGEFQKQIDDDAKALASAKGKPPVDLSTSAKPPCLSKKNEAALFTFFIKPAKECWKQIKVEGTMIKNAEKQFQLDICASIQNKYVFNILFVIYDTKCLLFITIYSVF